MRWCAVIVAATVICIARLIRGRGASWDGERLLGYNRVKRRLRAVQVGEQVAKIVHAIVVSLAVKERPLVIAQACCP